VATSSLQRRPPLQTFQSMLVQHSKHLGNHCGFSHLCATHSVFVPSAESSRRNADQPWCGASGDVMVGAAAVGGNAYSYLTLCVAAASWDLQTDCATGGPRQHSSINHNSTSLMRVDVYLRSPWLHHWPGSWHMRQSWHLLFCDS